MKVIRSATFESHSAAREIGGGVVPARSVARTAGQAVATAHVPARALAAANYPLLLGDFRNLLVSPKEE